MTAPDYRTAPPAKPVTFRRPIAEEDADFEWPSCKAGGCGGCIRCIRSWATGCVWRC